MRFLTIGICGGFTAFLYFSLETLRLIRAGELWREVVLYWGFGRNLRDRGHSIGAAPRK